MRVQIDYKSYQTMGKGNWFVMIEDLFSYLMIYCGSQDEQLVWFDYYSERGYFVSKGYADKDFFKRGFIGD